MTSSILSNSIDKLSEKIGKVAYFENEYEKILSEVQLMNLYIYDLDTISEVALDGGNLLSIILSNGIRLRANFEKYCYRKKKAFMPKRK